jgi:hypothetical protein
MELYPAATPDHDLVHGRGERCLLQPFNFLEALPLIRGHVSRNYVLLQNGAGRGSDALRSHQALAYYRQLYELERAAKGFSDAQRLQMRQDTLQQGVRCAVFSPDGRALALADGVGGVAWCDVALTIRAARFGAERDGSGPGEGGSP